MNIANIFKSVEQRLDENHLKHVQPLLRMFNGRLAIKFVSCDSPKYKEKIKEICDKYFTESLMLVKESKTTLTYSL